MTILSLSESENILKPHTEAIDEILQLAFNRYHALSDKHEYSPRSRASLIHDFIVVNAKRYFSNIPYTKIFYTRGLFTISFNDRLLLRFKKIYSSMRASNIPTQQALWFEQNRQVEMFPDLPPPTVITAGYIPDNTWTKIERKVITCFRDKKIEWIIPIETKINSVVIPIVDKADTHSSKNRVRPKFKVIKEVNYGQND